VALVTSAIAVRERLPREGQLRTEPAASATGDAHALDDGTPLAAVVLRALVDPVPSSAASRSGRRSAPLLRCHGGSPITGFVDLQPGQETFGAADQYPSSTFGAPARLSPRHVGDPVFANTGAAARSRSFTLPPGSYRFQVEAFNAIASAPSRHNPTP
jgi:hypothetical protein